MDDSLPNVSPHSYALFCLTQAHLRHLEKSDAELLTTVQWTTAAQTPETVACVKLPGEVIEAEDIPMAIGTGAPDRRRHLYSSTPCPPSVAAAADESEVAIFTYNRRGRIQPANSTAESRQSRAWYPSAKSIAPMSLFDDQVWEPATETTEGTGRPGVFEAAAGWLVLLVLLVFLAGSAYLALWYFDVI